MAEHLKMEKEGWGQNSATPEFSKGSKKDKRKELQPWNDRPFGASLKSVGPKRVLPQSPNLPKLP